MFLFSEACYMLYTVDECVKWHMTYHVVGEMMNDRGMCVSGVVLCAEYLAACDSDGEEEDIKLKPWMGSMGFIPRRKRQLSFHQLSRMHGDNLGARCSVLSEP